MRGADKLKAELQRRAELLSVAPVLLFPIHPDALHGVPYCEGSGKRPRAVYNAVYNNVHKEVGDITAFCPGTCLQIAVLESGLGGFKWELRGVYGVAEDGTPLGP